ncbi:MAG: hypothetical protein OXC82_04785 [Rhodobacteraceae bacterium]|nr:hypothetical protein [Paracoccaceae bacterium]MCY4249736.1 hypothetical protein [Paracoccaceae bacterium]
MTAKIITQKSFAKNYLSLLGSLQFILAEAVGLMTSTYFHTIWRPNISPETKQPFFVPRWYSFQGHLYLLPLNGHVLNFRLPDLGVSVQHGCNDLDMKEPNVAVDVTMFENTTAHYHEGKQ